MASSSTTSIDTLGFDPEELSKRGLNAIRASIGILGILGVVIGGAMIAWPGKTFVVVGALTGVYFAFAGVVRIALGIFSREVGAGYRILNIVLGLFLLLAGVLLLRNLVEGSIVLGIGLAIIIGIGWIVQGIMSFIAVGKGRSSGWGIASGVIGVLAGLVVLAVPGLSLAWLAIITGIILLILGIAGIVQAFTLGNNKAAA